MYQLFRDSPLFEPGGMVIPDFRRIRTGLQTSLSKVITFRRQNPTGLNASHFLVRLLQSLNVPMTLSTMVFDDKVRDIALNLGMGLRMTSALSQGRIFTPGVFYGDGVTEVLIASIDPYDLKALEGEGWKDLRPIQVLYHPKSDLNLTIPDGRHSTPEAGMAVITVNIPMLASQYRKWRTFQNSASIDTPRSIMQFLQEIPIPNMLYSHLDVAIMNRLIGKFFDVELENTRSMHSFYLTDWVDEVDRALDYYLEYCSLRKLDFDTLISYVPTVSAENLHEVLRLPDLAFTQQLQWAVVIARLPIVVFLVQFNAKYDNPRNRSHLHYLRHYLRQMDLGRVMRRALPEDRYQDVMGIIEQGVAPYV